MSKKKSTPPQFSQIISDFCQMTSDAIRDYTQLARCRKLRRQSKDTAEILEPFVAFITSEKGKNVMNLMREALGKTRKVEERMTGRVYRYKVLQGDEISQ